MPTDTKPVESTVLDRLEQCSTSAIADTNHGSVTTLASAIESIHTDGTVAGPVRTVALDPAALSAPVQTLDTARKDEVVVVDAEDSTDEAIWGELLSTYATATDVRGMVTNGAVRDVSGIRDLGFPVFARAVTPRGPSGSEEAERNGQVTVGGALITPGDVLVGDDSGVVVIERAAVEDVTAAAEAIAETERDVDRLIGEGRSLEQAFEDAGM
ncbi:RraA family protein [Halorarum halophilum]|uniref:RraA family protein n=2 Tax=Halorarum halophilum TaxID=2743090 RepID=A0A7D5GHS8_9EURY|nr:RraA family protein [Halobaculum halophilum]